MIHRILYVFLFHILRYRRSVVASQMESCNFGRDYVIKYYKYLSRLIIDTPFLWLQSAEKRASLTKIDSKLIINQEGPTFILASHLDNWELAITSLPCILDAPIYGIYKPLSNIWIDRWIYKRRSKYGLSLVAMQDVARVLASNPNGVFIFINDQSPPVFFKGKWVTFFDRKTMWYDGVVRLGVRYKATYSYMSVDWDKSINISFYPIASDSQILEYYVEKLESDIKQRPERWLWSHNRWKHNYE